MVLNNILYSVSYYKVIIYYLNIKFHKNMNFTLLKKKDIGKT